MKVHRLLPVPDFQNHHFYMENVPEGRTTQEDFSLPLI